MSGELQQAAELIKFMLPFLDGKSHASGDVSGVVLNAKDWLDRFTRGTVSIGDNCFLDNDRSIAAKITGVLWKGTGVQFEVAYIHNGDLKTGWVDSWRATIVGR